MAAWTAAGSSSSWSSKGSSCSSTASYGASCRARSPAPRAASRPPRGRTWPTRPCGCYQLSFDGITLVEVENGKARHTIRDLSQQNAGSRNPLDREPAPGEDVSRARLKNVEDCYRDGDSLRNLFVRPNQVFLTNANRTDVFFKAPVNAAGKVYTVFAQEFPLPTDNFQQRLQVTIASGRPGFTPGNPAPFDVVVGYIRVSGEPVPGGDFDVMSLRDKLPPVPPFLLPVEDRELRVPAGEATRRGVPAGSFRTRVISYSGYGPTDFPLINVPAAFAASILSSRAGCGRRSTARRVLLPPFSRTMAVSGAFDLASNPNPPAPQKFGHHDPASPEDARRHERGVGALQLLDLALEPHGSEAVQAARPVRPALPVRIRSAAATGRRASRAIPSSRSRPRAPITRSTFTSTRAGSRASTCRTSTDGCTTSSMRRSGWTRSQSRGAGAWCSGRASRDYVGMWVNHCHILMHEDHGMMQAVETVPRAADANYLPRTRVASHAMSSDEVNAIYPPPSRELMYRQSMTFVDASPELGQVFPGFPLDVPTVE